MRRQLIYILAASYSGSTLLTLLLAGHPDISTVGELKASALGDIDKYKCSCGQEITKCHFWKRVKQEMNSLGAYFELQDFKTHFKADSPFYDRLLRASVRRRFIESARDMGIAILPKCKDKLKAILNQNRLLIEVICNIQGGHIFLDSSKDPIRLRHLLWSGYWNIKVIHLVRDGRGETNSYMRHHGVPMQIAVREWIKTCRECINIMKRFSPANWLTVRYEDICLNPKETLDQIYGFIGVDSTYDTINTSQQHILGNAMRLRPLKRIQLDEKWKRNLTEDDLYFFEQIAGQLNASYGYK